MLTALVSVPGFASGQESPACTDGFERGPKGRVQPASAAEDDIEQQDRRRAPVLLLPVLHGASEKESVQVRKLLFILRSGNEDAIKALTSTLTVLDKVVASEDVHSSLDADSLDAEAERLVARLHPSRGLEAVTARRRSLSKTLTVLDKVVASEDVHSSLDADSLDAEAERLAAPLHPNRGLEAVTARRRSLSKRFLGDQEL